MVGWLIDPSPEFAARLKKERLYYWKSGPIRWLISAPVRFLDFVWGYIREVFLMLW